MQYVCTRIIKINIILISIYEFIEQLTKMIFIIIFSSKILDFLKRWYNIWHIYYDCRVWYIVWQESKWKHSMKSFFHVTMMTTWLFNFWQSQFSISLEHFQCNHKYNWRSYHRENTCRYGMDGKKIGIRHKYLNVI